MNLLLHTCCAPCLLFPLERLRDKGFSVSGFFYNPNIHGFLEYKNRLDAANRLGQSQGIVIDAPEYLPQEYFRAVYLQEEGRKRCRLCWRLRLEKTASLAKARGCDYFTTTLLVSPYQDQESLKSIGEDCAAKEGVKFYYEDFRPGFRPAHDKAKAAGIYCQKYCGCVYSEIERYKKKS